MSVKNGNVAVLKRLLFVWGNGDCGRLGLKKSLKNKTIPTYCDGLDDVVDVSCGAAHTVAVTKDGQVWSFGLNTYYQLGHSINYRQVTVPVKVRIPEAIKSVSCADSHTLCLSESGNIWSFGCNSYGETGIGKVESTSRNVEKPTKINDFNASHISCNGHHSLAVTKDGEIFSWGTNSHGQLGHDKNIFESGSEFYPRLIRKLRGIVIKRASAGHSFSSCIDINGQGYVWGNNNFWQLGLPEHTTEEQYHPKQNVMLNGMEDVSLGGVHGIGTCIDNSVCVWGMNEHGCLGIPQPTPHSLQPYAKTPFKLKDVFFTQVSAGWKHSAGITKNGELYCWGWGGSTGQSSLQLNFSENEENSDDGTGGQLGLGNDFDFWTPQKINFKDNIRAIKVSCGFNHTAAILEISE